MNGERATERKLVTDREISEEEGKKFLSAHAKYIREVMVRAGWDAIDALIEEEG